MHFMYVIHIFEISTILPHKPTLHLCIWRLSNKNKNLLEIALYNNQL